MARSANVSIDGKLRFIATRPPRRACRESSCSCRLGDRSYFIALMHGDDTRAQIMVTHALESGLLHHSFQRFLIRMAANRLGQVAIAVLVVGDESPKQR